VSIFLLVRLTAWPPHEDETLALFVGDDSLGGVIATVAGERGGAPLHFLIAWAVGGLGGGLTELRLASALFAVAAVPLVALLGARLAGRAAGLVAAAVVSASWMLLFHGIYARMYSLFLATSLLSYLALLAAAERGGLRRWALWCLATIVMVSAHPYGALVVASQGLYVLLVRARLREAVPAFAVVGVLGLPFWYSDLVLARRFEVGVGSGGRKLDGPVDILVYLARAAGDFTAGWRLVLAGVLVLALVGLVVLWRSRRTAAILALAVFGTPALALLVARLGSSAAPESRHLIFAFPFLALLIAVGILRVAARSPVIAPALVAGLLVAELVWAHGRTPLLFEGEPPARAAARAEASDWLAETGRADDVLLGYDPLFLGAWERDRSASRLVVPRADSTLALKTLDDAGRLGRGVWVLDASDTNNFAPSQTIEHRVPKPEAAFETRTFGPFLVVRTRQPVVSPDKFLELSSNVMITGKSLFLGDADLNFVTVRKAADQLSRERERSASASSR
jgi:hypothetical protein